MYLSMYYLHKTLPIVQNGFQEKRSKKQRACVTNDGKKGRAKNWTSKCTFSLSLYL